MSLDLMPLGALLFFALILIGIALLIRQVAKKYGAVTALFIVVGGGVFLMMLSVVLMRMTYQQTTTPELVVETAMAAPLEPAVWANIDPQQFTANESPSIQTAMKSLARQVRETLTANHLLVESMGDETESAVESEPTGEAASDEQAEVATDGAVTPAQVRVTGHLLSDKHRDDVLQWFTEQLRLDFPDSEVNIFDGRSAAQDTDGELKDGTVWLTLSLPSESVGTAPWDSQGHQVGGQYCCHVTTSTGSAQVTTRYIEKPWVETFDVFVSAHPNRRFVVGYSGKLVSSEEEARRLANNDAIAKLQDDIRRGTIVAPNESHVIDRFAQKLSRPYGDVWREAILFDVSEDRMASAVASVQRQIRQTHRWQTTTGFSLLVLFGVAMVLCVVLNLLTQGYYRKRLLIAGGVVAAIIFLMFVGF